MKLHELKPPAGAVKKPKRVGRGSGSGHGKTSGRGNRGARARSGYSRKPGFEGGQMPMFRRLPKRGFKNPFKKEYAIINLDDLGKFNPNDEVTPEALLQKNLIKKLKDGVKVLGDGEVLIPLIVKVHKISNSAREKIEKVGGKVQVI